MWNQREDQGTPPDQTNQFGAIGKHRPGRAEKSGVESVNRTFESTPVFF